MTEISVRLTGYEARGATAACSGILRDSSSPHAWYRVLAFALVVLDAAPPRRVARVAARCVASEPDAVRVTRATGRTVALVASSAACASAATPAHALSDAWFGWYFAPGGFALGPALFLTAFLLGQAVFEKVTGTGPSKDRSDDEKR